MDIGKGIAIAGALIAVGIAVNGYFLSPVRKAESCIQTAFSALEVKTLNVFILRTCYQENGQS